MDDEDAVRFHQNSEDGDLVRQRNSFDENRGGQSIGRRPVNNNPNNMNLARYLLFANKPTTTIKITTTSYKTTKLVTLYTIVACIGALLKFSYLIYGQSISN